MQVARRVMFRRSTRPGGGAVLTIAVTGGIGAGKSTVARMLGQRGAVVIDADRLARDVVAPGTAGLAAVVDEFGRTMLADDGSLDRAALADRVFADDAARTRLEGIIHPRVRREFERRCDAAGPDAVVVNDIPLVRTPDEAARFDLVVTVSAADDVRIRRLVARGLAERDARARIAAQITDDERRALSDVWVTNDGDEAALTGEVQRLWETWIAPHTGGQPQAPS